MTSHWVMGMNVCPLCLYQCSVTTVQIKWCNLLSTQSKINVKNELTTVSRRGIQRVKVVSSPIRLSSSLNFGNYECPPDSYSNPEPEKLCTTNSFCSSSLQLTMFAVHTLVKHQIKCDLSFICDIFFISVFERGFKFPHIGKQLQGVHPNQKWV